MPGAGRRALLICCLNADALSCGAETRLRGAGVPRRSGQTTQRRKMCPSCGAEIGLKAGSHPVGILPWDRGRAGDSGGAASSSAPFAGFANGRRSPLWVRSTVMRSCPADKPAPVVGNDGNTIRAAVNKKSESTPTALARRAVVPHIGSSPKRSPPSPMSRMRDRPCGPGAHRQRVQGRVVPQPHRPIGVGACSQLRDHNARSLTAITKGATNAVIMRGGTNTAPAACCEDRPSFPPSPRAWPAIMGATDRPIGCALTLLGGAHIAHMMQAWRRSFVTAGLVQTCSGHRRLCFSTQDVEARDKRGRGVQSNLIRSSGKNADPKTGMAGEGPATTR